MKNLSILIAVLFCINLRAQETAKLSRMNSMNTRNQWALSLYGAPALSFSMDKKISLGPSLAQIGVSAQYYFVNCLSPRTGYYFTATNSKVNNPGLGKSSNSIFTDINYYPKFLGGFAYFTFGEVYSFAKVYDEHVNSYVPKQQTYPYIGAGLNAPLNRILCRHISPNLYFEYFFTISVPTSSPMRLRTGMTNPGANNAGIGVKYFIPQKK